MHEIKTYPDAQPIRKHLHLAHPKKDVVIESEVDRFLPTSLIHFEPLTNWVSNIVPAMKKQGTINVCMDYQDVNRALP